MMTVPVRYILLNEVEMQERSEDGSWRTNPQKGMSCKNNGPPQMRKPGRFFRDVSPVCVKFLIIRGAVSNVGRFSRTLPHARLRVVHTHGLAIR
jgi:hypothetical protein